MLTTSGTTRSVCVQHPHNPHFFRGPCRGAARRFPSPCGADSGNSAPTETSSSGSSDAGPSRAFSPGQEGESRRVIFNRIAPVYDELNNNLSFGQHWVWKQMSVKWSGAKAGHQALDVCCGSGDLAFLLARAVGPTGAVTGLDFAAEMLADASSRQASSKLPGVGRYNTPMKWLQGDAMDMPFSANTFDSATMGYGLRNVADIPKALRELQRVLKPGASVAILDFNNTDNPVLDGLQSAFLEYLVVPAARQYGLQEEYEYLRPSIKAFPTGSGQEAAARAAGFVKVKHYEVGFGLMGILVATKGK